MSVTNIINNEELTLVQRVGGLFLCEESWITQNRRNTYRKDISDKEMITTKTKITVLNVLRQNYGTYLNNQMYETGCLNNIYIP